MEKGLAKVLFRLPGEKLIQSIGPGPEIIWDGQIKEEPIFLFAPFDTSKHPILTIGKEEKSDDLKPIAAPNSQQEKDDFIELVTRAIQHIQNGKAEKIVTARVKGQEAFADIHGQFLLLCEKHPQAFCYLWESDSVGIWMGATPELLLESSGKHIKTVALAGTQIQDSFGEKEQQEQGFVKDYIVETLSPFTTSLQVSKQQMVSSGHLNHLRNEITAELLEIDHLLPVLNSLHPTPAVAGLPKKEVMDFIHRNEIADRTYYSGFLGLISKGRSTLFVNLRCLQVIHNHTYTYSGAGIIATSNPEKEWLETEEKMKVVMNASRN